jgi:hypothetical protein
VQRTRGWWRRCVRRCGGWAGVCGAVLGGLSVSGWCGRAEAQIVNPGSLVWEHPEADYAVTVRYEAGWYLSESAPSPVQVADLGRPDAAACVGTPTVTCTVPLPARPALGSWVIRVQAYGEDAATQTPLPSGWSAPSLPFWLSPRVPSGVRVSP